MFLDFLTFFPGFPKVGSTLHPTFFFENPLIKTDAPPMVHNHPSLNNEAPHLKNNPPPPTET